MKKSTLLLLVIALLSFVIFACGGSQGEDVEVSYNPGADSMQELHKMVIDSVRSDDFEAYMELVPSTSMMLAQQVEMMKQMYEEGNIEEEIYKNSLKQVGNDEYVRKVEEKLEEDHKKRFDRLKKSIDKYAVPESYATSEVEVAEPNQNGDIFAAIKYQYEGKEHNASLAGQKWDNDKFYFSGSSGFGY